MRYAATAAEAAANNVILGKGEFGYTADDDVLKVGDGVRHWNDLEAVGGGGGGGADTETIQDLVGAMVTGNTETGITVTYDDTLGKLNFVAAVTTAYTDEQAQDAVAAAISAGTQAGVTVTYNDGSNSLSFAIPLQVTDFFRTGTMATGTGTDRIYNLSGATRTIVHVGIALVTAPTGAAFVADVNKNGTTIFTTQSARPSITASTNSAVSGTPAVTSWANGDYLTIDRDQVGSTVAGSDLTGTIFWR